MKISEISIDGTKNLGQSNNRKFGFTAVIDEDETVSDAINRVQTVLDFALNRPERDAMYAKQVKRLAELEAANGDGDAVEKAKVEAWIEKYDTLKAEVEALN